MKVFGYTADKEVVELDLPPETIVAASIDPWTLDLFDPAPVVHKIDKQEFHFSRLGDLAFVYSADEKNVDIGIHDGVTRFCASGKCPPMPLALLRVRDISFGQKRFDDCWLAKLKQMESLSTQFLSPQFADCVQIYGGQVVVDLTSSDRVKPHFTGEMLTELQVPKVLPAEVNWVFKALSQWKPVVVGDALTRCMLDIPLTQSLPNEARLYGNESWHDRHGDVEVLVGRHDVRAIDSQLQSVFGKPVRESMSYEALLIRHPESGVRYKFHANRYETVHGWLDSQSDRHTALRLYSTCKNTVTGTRIALHDIGKRLIRLPGLPAPSSVFEEYRQWHEQHLEQQGFTLCSRIATRRKQGKSQD